MQEKFAWPPHYRKLPFVIAITVANDIISFNKLDRSQSLIDEFKVNLSSQDKWEVFQYVFSLIFDLEKLFYFIMVVIGIDYENFEIT